MLFCPKCGSIMAPKEEGKKMKLSCSCGYENATKEDILISEKVKTHKKIEIVEDIKKAMPKIEVECPKCSGMEAYSWSQQTRSSDEAETQFFECTKTKCAHRWRSYG
jgi:transcription factor S